MLRTFCALQAIERGEDDGRDWHASKESLLQARADEKTIQEVLGEVYAKQQVLLLTQSCVLAVAKSYTGPERCCHLSTSYVRD